MEATKVVPALCRVALTNYCAPPLCRLAQIDLLDDDDLDELHAQRIREMKAEAMRREEAKKKGWVSLSLSLSLSLSIYLLAPCATRPSRVWHWDQAMFLESGLRGRVQLRFFEMVNGADMHSLPSCPALGSTSRSRRKTFCKR
jgi:hypothetical protein